MLWLTVYRNCCGLLESTKGDWGVWGGEAKRISSEARQWNSNVLKQDVGFKGRRNRESHILVEIRNRNYKSFRQRLQFAIFKYIEIFSDIGKKFLLSIINSLNILFIDN